MLNDNSLHIITGATGGIGRAIAVALALEGKSLVLACRNTNAATVLAREIAQQTGNEDVTVVPLDLASFASVRRAAAQIEAMRRPVAALMNNAGIMTRNSHITEDGFEQTVQVNYLGTALLALLVAPLVREGGKIVFTTSITRVIYDIPDQWPYESNFSQLGTYGRSKLALTLFAIYLTTVLKTSGVMVECADPGVVNTKMITMDRWFDRLADICFRPFISSPSEGAKAALRALEATATGYIFHGEESTRLVTALKDKDKFVTLLNNTLRILNRQKQ